MAENSDQERTEDPTGKRLQDAREKGQVPRSRELGVFLMTLGGGVGLLFFGSQIANGLMDVMRGEFILEREELFDPYFLIAHFRTAIEQGVFMLVPFLALMIILAFVGPLALGGWVFSIQAMQPKFSKLDPIKGIPRLFAWRGLLELVKSLLKFVLVTVAAWIYFSFERDAFLGLSREPVMPALMHSISLLGYAFLFISSVLIVLAMIDIPFQLWDNHRKLKMTLQEVKDEMKDSEGKPEIKRKIRQMQMQLARGRMMEKVPEADVIVTNPTHYAVALQYDPSNKGAPKVVAKGTDLIAAQIRNIASGADVPLVAAPPLARAIYYSTEIDREIPAGLYLAVAQVLAYVYQLKAARNRPGYQNMPNLPADLPIPDEYLRPERG